MQPIENKIINRIYGHGRGWVFTPVDFLDIAVRPTVDSALRRLKESGTIRHISRGLYYYPQSHPKIGELSPGPEEIAKALAGKDQIRIQSTGAYAANLLGLSTQVPAKVVFLTDGPNRTVKVGRRTIVLKHTTPKNMKTAGTITGLVIQALRYMGKKHVSNKMILQLRRKLRKEDKKRLIKDIRFAPAWIGEVFREIIGEDSNG